MAFWDFLRKKKANRYAFNDEDRELSKTKLALKREKEKIEHTIEMEKLSQELKELKSEREEAPDLEDQIRDVVEEYLESDDEGSAQENQIAQFFMDKFMKPQSAPAQSPAALPSPPPETPTSSPAQTVPDTVVDMILADLPDNYKSQIADISKEQYLGISAAVWERLKTLKP